MIDFLQPLLDRTDVEECSIRAGIAEGEPVDGWRTFLPTGEITVTLRLRDREVRLGSAR